MTVPAGLYRPDDPDGERLVRYPVPVYLIEVNQSQILVDTGIHPGAADDFSAHYPEHPAPQLFSFELAAPLGELVDLTSLTHVIMTHLHFDHAGGLESVPADVPVVVQRREWQATWDPDSRARNFFQPHDYEGVAERVQLVDGDHDLFGDGSVRLLSTPGHTPGHQSVVVDDRLVIGGDVAHFASTLDDQVLPAFGDDLDAQRASGLRLRTLRDRGLEVTPGHDPALGAGRLL